MDSTDRCRCLWLLVPRLPCCSTGSEVRRGRADESTRRDGSRRKTEAGSKRSESSPFEWRAATWRKRVNLAQVVGSKALPHAGRGESESTPFTLRGLCNREMGRRGVALTYFLSRPTRKRGRRRSHEVLTLVSRVISVSCHSRPHLPGHPLPLFLSLPPLFFLLLIINQSLLIFPISSHPKFITRH